MMIRRPEQENYTILKESRYNEVKFSKGNQNCEIETLVNDEKDSEFYENTDDVLEKLGEFGFRTKVSLFFLVIFLFLMAWNGLAYLFYGLESPWYCLRSDHGATSCNFTSTISMHDVNFERRCKMNRTDWQYERSKYFSMITEYDLVCDKKQTAQLTLYFAPCARFFGFIPAILCDVIGRKPILYASTIMVILCNVIGYFARDLILIMITVLLAVASYIGVLISGYLIATEIVGPKKRSFASNLYWAIWPSSFCLLSIVGYAIPYWRTIRLALSLPSLLLLFTWWYIPESPRWLHVQGKLEESSKVLSKLVGKDKEDDIKLKKITVQYVSVKAILTKSSLINKHIFFSTLNFFMSLVYFGISLSATLLSGNFYLDFGLLSLFEIPAVLLTIYLCDRFGRKLSTVVPIWICFVLLAGISGVPLSYRLLRSVLGITAKFFISISFNAEYLLVSESYATSVRSQALIIINFGVLVGNACAPWITLGLEGVASYLPFVLMTVVAAITAVMCHFMVETKGKPTLEVMIE